MRVLRRHPRAAVCLLLVCLVAGAAAEQVGKLKPEGYVNDFAGVLSARASSDIYQLCAQVEEKTGAQIAVVTIHKLEGMEASDFANRLFAKWGVGHKDNRGILILLAVDDRKYWVEVGYGLEPILNDAKVGGFGREMVPYLKQGDYGHGALLLTERIAAVIAQERGVTLPPSALPQAPRPRTSQGDWLGPLLFFLVMAIIFGPFVAAILAYLFTGKWPKSVSSGRGWSSGGWSSGGSSWGGFGGGGGGGGFGGFGGGMSGGGGAGGSW